ncbi:uncharacterized protein LOC112602137 isoform X2 [Melanaphis sacchari]|uniref:uncharacterized protein LOC112602137 isoform X2 n=1 Tax=Melanaphis sacchari TaxID=742174 RepID=UPI000DC15158|nr:uncharacterized protein LOC112602137 isoform X2 [Melanaphis sacchari]
MNDSDGYDNSVLIINDDGEMDYSDSEVTIYNDDDHYHSNNNNNIVDEKFIENLVTCIIDDDYDNKNSVSKVANDKQPTKEAMIPLDDTVENAKVKIIDDNGKDADDDDDSSDDDTNSVNVIINDWRPPEHELDDLLDANDFHDEKEFINLPTQEVNQLVLKNIEKTRSNSPRRYILIYVNGITIPVAVENTKLSAAIQYNIWYPPKCTRTDYKMIAVDSFNKKMMNMYSQFVENTNRKCDDGCRNGEYVGYFAAMYDNAVNGNISSSNHLSKDPNGCGDCMEICVENEFYNPSDSRVEKIGQSSKYKDSKLYFFKEFSLIIMKNGQFVNASIHGLVNSIEDLLDRYNVKTVYVNCDPGTSLDTFLSYKHQPFYRALHSRKLVYLIGYLKYNIGTLPYCSRNNAYCSFCRCINTITKHYKIENINIKNARMILEKFQFSQRNDHDCKRNNDDDDDDDGREDCDRKKWKRRRNDNNRSDYYNEDVYHSNFNFGFIGKRNRYRHYYNHRQHYHQQRRQHQYQLQQQQQNYYHHVNYARCRREEDDSTGATTVAARFCRNLVNRKKNLRLVRVKNNNNS